MLEAKLFETKLNYNKKSDDNDLDEEDINSNTIAFVLFFYIIILFWAISRALKCSQKTPDSRAIHLLFCFVSPSLYLVCSYAVPGFCVQ